MTADLIILAVLMIIIGAAVAYIIKEKKRGEKCIGCPNGGTCPNSGKCSGNCHGGCSVSEGK